MRRAITLIMVLGIVIAGAAAADTNIEVTYDLNTSALQEIKVAITAKPVTDVIGAKDASTGSGVALTAEAGATEATYGTGDTGLYLVWYAYTANNVRVTLGIDPMEATGSDGSSKSYLPWTVIVSNEYQTTENNGTALKASQSTEGTNDDTVTVDKAGEYELLVYYCTGEERGINIVVNDSDRYEMTGLTGAGFDIPDAASITVALNAGENTIELTRNSGYAPDLDMIAVSEDPV